MSGISALLELEGRLRAARLSTMFRADGQAHPVTISAAEGAEILAEMALAAANRDQARAAGRTEERARVRAAVKAHRHDEWQRGTNVCLLDEVLAIIDEVKP